MNWPSVSRVFVFLLAFAAISELDADEPDVYVIASEPCDDCINRFPTLLFRLDGTELTKVRTVTTQMQDTMFIHAYHDKGYVLIGSEGSTQGTFLLDVISIDLVSAQKSYDVDVCQGCSYLSSYLLSRNNELIYVFRGGANERFDWRRGVNLKTGMMSSDLNRGHEGYAYSGAYGSGFVDWGFVLGGVFSDNNEAVIYDESDKYPLGWSPPDELDLRLGKEFTLQFVNNDHLRVISAGGYTPVGSRNWSFYVFNKGQGAWSKLNLSGGIFALRSYQNWLITEEIYNDTPDVLVHARLAEQRYPPFPSAADRFRIRGIAPTGRLRFYDVRKKELIVYDTGDPNSEVLYVDENDSVYYRVSDELRLAQIERGELVRSRVLAKVPEMWAVHWLFLGRE